VFAWSEPQALAKAAQATVAQLEALASTVYWKREVISVMNSRGYWVAQVSEFAGPAFKRSP